jgi:alpha-amylase/alpha-mannosidase (GH57 family)
MFVTIHGHFYQPPRENPWTGEIQRQQGAAPFHDWNERITDECYGPNGRSRVLDPQGRIVALVNNYTNISFDFGPTLLSDLARRFPRVYRRILDADRESISRHGGHGSGMAQAYNHAILPLANLPDKWTQVRWGLRDFQSRFGRPSEGLWLSETAIDAETLRVVAEAGVRFLILAPHQALRVRRLGERKWEECGAAIDTGRAYRCFADPARRTWIDCFFYDGPLSVAASFEHLMRDAGSFAGRLQAAGQGRGPDGLVHMATDGEIYGHHEAFADMCLAFLFQSEAQRRGIRFVNYPEFLDLFPPAHEVQLNFTDTGEGTAWSCAHGVGRWIRDCGCSNGGQPGWNQRWRTPLRRGLDALRDQVQAAYLTQAGRHLRDPWAARDDYIEVLLRPDAEARAAFLDRHLREPVDAESRRMIWSLLEATHQAMLMYTSCAWFFADISGLEVQQNLGYAARACELAQPYCAELLEPLLLTHLEQARSNLPEWGDGARVYRSLVRPRRVGPEHAAAQAALEAAVLDRSLDRRVFQYGVHGTLDPGCRGNEIHCSGHLRVEEDSLASAWSWDFLVAPGALAQRMVTLSPAVDPQASLGPFTGTFGLMDLQLEVREAIAQAALGQALEDEQARLRELFQDSRAALQVLVDLRLPLPEVHRSLARYCLGVAYQALAARVGRDAAAIPAGWWDGVEAVVAEQERLGLEVIAAPATGKPVAPLAAPLAAALADRINDLLDRALGEPSDLAALGLVRAAHETLAPADRLRLPLVRTWIEPRVYELALRFRAELNRAAAAGAAVDRPAGYEEVNALRALAGHANLELSAILRDGMTAGA